jgi:hypothetical protein
MRRGLARMLHLFARLMEAEKRAAKATIYGLPKR